VPASVWVVHSSCHNFCLSQEPYSDTEQITLLCSLNFEWKLSLVIPFPRHTFKKCRAPKCWKIMFPHSSPSPVHTHVDSLDIRCYFRKKKSIPSCDQPHTRKEIHVVGTERAPQSPEIGLRRDFISPLLFPLQQMYLCQQLLLKSSIPAFPTWETHRRVQLFN